MSDNNNPRIEVKRVSTDTEGLCNACIMEDARLSTVVSIRARGLVMRLCNRHLEEMIDKAKKVLESR